MLTMKIWHQALKKKQSHHSSDAELHGHFLGVIECEAKVGIFKEYKVGKGTGYDFARAMQEGCCVLNKIKKNHGSEIQTRGMVSVCPENPTKIAIVRCLPGMLVNKSAEEVRKIINSNEVTVKAIPAGKYLVYLHVGSYKTLANSWQLVSTEFEKRGYKLLEGEACFEEYVNDPSVVQEHELQTKICWGIAPEE